MALHQNWFSDNKRFEMFEEFYETQWLYDIETKCFYVIQELNDGTVQIIEHNGEENDVMYPNLMCRYEEWKRNQIKDYTVNFAASVDVTISACSPEEAREKARNSFGEYYEHKFEYDYINEIYGVIDENGNEV